MKKKRASAALLAAALSLALLAGCGGDPTGSGGGRSSTPAPVPTPGNTPVQPAQSVVPPSTDLKKPPQPDQILSDANQSKKIELPDGIRFTACEVVKRQSNPENKEDIVYCTLTAENSFYRTQRQYRFLYNYYDEGGWILDKVTPEDEDEWVDAYLDAAGNDILEDMIWLDAFSADQIKNMQYIGEAAGVHYVAVASHYRGDYDYQYNICRSNGSSVAVWEPGLRKTIETVFTTADGQLRFIVMKYVPNGDHSYRGMRVLTDAYGVELSDTYGWMSLQTFSDPTVRVVYSEDSLYGALDENGAAAIPPEYASTRDLPGIQYRETQVPDYEPVEWDGQTFRSYGDYPNGVFSQYKSIAGWTGSELINGRGQPIFSLPYESQYYDKGDGLVMLFPECLKKGFNDVDAIEAMEAGTDENMAMLMMNFGFDVYSSPFRLYDLNGNCRSPEFTWVCGGGLAGQRNRLIVSYQGRCGYLPQILTDEETTYFWYLWGMEHAK